MLPLAPARNSVLYCALACLARARATCVSLLKWGLRVRPCATVVILCDNITNQLLASIPHKLNLDGIHRTIYGVVWSLRLAYSTLRQRQMLWLPYTVNKADGARS